MKPRKVILVTHDPQTARWQVTPTTSGRLALLGWRVSPELEQEAGVPEEVALLLARSLTQVARVTFPCSSDLETSPDDFVRVLETTGLRARLGAAFSRSPSRFLLVATRRPEVAKTLFDDGGFPWWLQGQILILSALDAPPPDLDKETLLSLMNPHRPLDSKVFASLQILAVVHPGVDGDVAAIIASNEDFERQILDSLEEESRFAGFDWRVLSEDAFAEALSTQEG